MTNLKKFLHDDLSSRYAKWHVWTYSSVLTDVVRCLFFPKKMVRYAPETDFCSFLRKYWFFWKNCLDDKIICENFEHHLINFRVKFWEKFDFCWNLKVLENYLEILKTKKINWTFEKMIKNLRNIEGYYN